VFGRNERGIGDYCRLGTKLRFEWPDCPLDRKWNAQSRDDFGRIRVTHSGGCIRLPGSCTELSASIRWRRPDPSKGREFALENGSLQTASTASPRRDLLEASRYSRI